MLCVQKSRCPFFATEQGQGCNFNRGGCGRITLFVVGLLILSCAIYTSIRGFQSDAIAKHGASYLKAGRVILYITGVVGILAGGCVKDKYMEGKLDKFAPFSMIIGIVTLICAIYLSVRGFTGVKNYSPGVLKMFEIGSYAMGITFLGLSGYFRRCLGRGVDPQEIPQLPDRPAYELSPQAAVPPAAPRAPVSAAPVAQGATGTQTE